MYVEDVARAFEIILHRGTVGQIYNIGSNTEFSNLEIAHKLLDLHGLGPQRDKYITFVEDRVFNDKRYASAVFCFFFVMFRMRSPRT